MSVNPLAKLNLHKVILAKKGAKFPARGTYFVIAANGAFVRKDLGIFEGLVSMPIKDVPGAVEVGYAVPTAQGIVYIQKSETVVKNDWWKKKEEEEDDLQIVDPSTGELMGDTEDNMDQRLLAVEPYINMNLPKLEQEIIYKALLFFRKVFNKYKAEAIILLAYNEANKEYALFCPKQQVSGAHIDYDRDLSERLTTVRKNEDEDWFELLESGYTKVGTIHSHCDFQAFHSGTDTGDEASFNGVHITLGHVVSQEFSVAASLVLNDYREEVDVENFALGVKRTGDKKAANSAFISSGRQNFYQIDILDEEKQILKDQFEMEIDNDWMNKVTVKQRNYQGGSQGYVGGYMGGQGSYVGGYPNYTSPNYDDNSEFTKHISDLEGGTTYVPDEDGRWVKENRKSEMDDYDYDIWATKHPEVNNKWEDDKYED